MAEPNLTSVADVLDVRHETIEAAPVIAMVRALLEVDSLDNVCEIHIGHDALEVVVFALDKHGHRFVRGDEAALDRHVFPLRWSS